MPSKAVELRELPDDDLYVRIESAKEELFNLRFQLATGQRDNTARLKELRHEVARLATVLRERELELDRIAAAQAREDVAEEDVEGATRRRRRTSRTISAVAWCSLAWFFPVAWRRRWSCAST